MTDAKEKNIRNFNSLLLTVLFLFGLLIWHNASDLPVKHGHVVVSEVNTCDNAILKSGIELPGLQRLIVLQKECFLLSEWNKRQLLQNLESDQKLSDLEVLRINAENLPSYFHLFHLFPSEKDDLPPLS
jgi:hypothetical protein